MEETTGWLLEIETNSGPMWLCLIEADRIIYTNDSLHALRFGRQCDADAFREWHDLGSMAKPTKHSWAD